jgi:hypothetical protein
MERFFTMSGVYRFFLCCLRLVPTDGESWIEGTPLLLGGVAGLAAPSTSVLVSKSQARVARQVMKVSLRSSNTASINNREQRGAGAAEGFLSAVISKMKEKEKNLIVVDHFSGAGAWLLAVSRLIRNLRLPSEFLLKCFALEHRDHCFAIGFVFSFRICISKPNKRFNVYHDVQVGFEFSEILQIAI